jgi:hypothetical protein
MMQNFRISTRGLLQSTRITTTALALTCLVGFLAQLVLIWPGIADFDTVYIFEQIQSGGVGNWHPPVFARLWQLFLSLGLGGTGPLYGLQLVLFWCGASLWTVGFARIAKPVTAIGLLLVVVLTPAIGFEQVVTKDAQMTSALMLATGACAWYYVQGRALPWFAVAGVAILLVYAQLVRANGVFSVLPLAVMLAVTSVPGTWCWGRGLVVGLAMAALFFGTPSINSRIFRAVDERPERQIALYDLAGVAHFARLKTLRGATPEQWSQAEAKGCYQAFYADRYYDPNECSWINDVVFQRPDIWEDWGAAVVAHPVDYLRHRLGHWNTTMRMIVAAKEPRRAADPEGQPNTQDLGANDNRVAWLTFKLQTKLAATPLYWPAFWYVLGFGMLWPALSMAEGAARRLAFCLIPSSLALSSSFLLVSISGDLRYHIWSMIAVALASTLVVADRSTSQKRLLIVMAIAVLVALVGLVARVVIAPTWPGEA